MLIALLWQVITRAILWLWLIATGIIALSLIIGNGIAFGVAFFATAHIPLVAVAGTKWGIVFGDRQEKIGVPIVGIALLVLAYFIARTVMVDAFGDSWDGLSIAVSSGIIGFVCVPMSWAGPIAKPPSQADGMKTKVIRQSNKSNDERIVLDFAELMANGTLKPDAIYDTWVLPHPKEDILLAIEQEILREPLDARVEWLAVGATFLPFFQPSVGPNPLFRFGADLIELQRSTPNAQDLLKILRQSPERHRAEWFFDLMEKDKAQIDTRIKAAKQLRNARQQTQRSA